MSASSLVSCILGHDSFGKPIDVYSRGGLVRCQPTVSDSHQYFIFLSGNATFVFSSTIEFKFPNVSHFTSSCGKIFVDEIHNSGRVIEYSEQMLKLF